MILLWYYLIIELIFYTIQYILIVERVAGRLVLLYRGHIAILL